MIYKANIYILLFLVLFICCGPKTDMQGSFALKMRYKQYYINGKGLYMNYCSNCHQKDGSGLVRLYPPINIPDYYQDDPARTICIIRNGKSFNPPMPENTDLTNLEIAELVTYLYGNWGKKDKLVKPEEVAKILKGCPLPPTKGPENVLF